jgi:hypothetical protein
MKRLGEMSSRVLIGACVASLYACGDGSGGGGSASTAGSLGGAGTEAKDECPGDYQAFSTGKNGTLVPDAKSGIAVRVIDGPVPPEYGYNTWKIALLDANTMMPAPNARLTWQCAFMSVHGHGSNPKSIKNLGNGEYEIVDQNLRMFGPWEVQFWIDPTGTKDEYVPTSNLISGSACSPTTGGSLKPNIEIKLCVPRSSD